MLTFLSQVKQSQWERSVIKKIPLQIPGIGRNKE
jgi:hypothetical protein